MVKRGVADLLDGQKLPIWFSARDCYLKIPEARLGWPVSTCDPAGVIIECVEFWCTIHELGESWAVKIDVIEERLDNTGRQATIALGEIYPE